MRKRNFSLIMFAIILIVGVSFGGHQYRLQHPNRDHPMTQLTKNMQTVCFGRYLMDIPATAEFSMGSAEIDDIQITHKGIVPNEVVFRNQVKQRETELRAQKHDTEGTRLREELGINEGKQRMFVYRGNNFSTSLSFVETTSLSNRNLWLIHYEAADEDVPEVKNLIARFATNLQSRDMLEIPKTPGFCIKNGFISSVGKESENLIAGIQMELPVFSITIKSETSGPRERGNTLWDRVERAEKDVNEIYGIKLPIGVVRRAEVQVDGRKGQEYVTITPEKGIERFNAKAEIYGDATPKKPTFKIEMDAAWVKNPSKDQKKHMLSKEEALALWDSILKNIRPRPGAF